MNEPQDDQTATKAAEREVELLRQRYQAAVMTFGIDAPVTQAAKRRWEDARQAVERSA